MVSSEPTSLPDIGVHPGDVLAGKYRVERVLGIGGMGAVVQARHLELEEPVAIKLLLPHFAPEGEPVARFLREARAAKRIRSPHVVVVHDVGRMPNGSPFMVMEYLEGTDLAGYLDQNGPLPHPFAITLVLQACEAIAAAHAIGIVHRDLKPANLFLTTLADGSPCIKVLDFGIAKLADPIAKSGIPTDPLIPVSVGPAAGLTSTATVMGTPCYMSPEQLRSTRDVDGRTDIWSIGAILHALLAGAPPFNGESNIDVSAKIIRDLPFPIRQLRPDVPEALERVILTCLEKDVSRRFVDVAQLAAALAHAGSDAAIATAKRIARASAATGPTLRSQSEPPFGPVPASAGPAISNAGPTRTASAWGESASYRAPASARLGTAGAVALVLSGVMVVGAAGVWGGAKLASRGRALAASAPAGVPSAAASSSPPGQPVSAATAEPAPPSASATPTLAVSSLPTAPPTRTTSPRTAPPATASTRPAPASGKPKPPGGLFDDRE